MAGCGAQCWLLPPRRGELALHTHNVQSLSEAVPAEATSESDPGKASNAGLSLQGGSSQCCVPVLGHNAGSSLLGEGESQRCDPL